MISLPPFALSGGKPLFAQPKPTGNLYRPNIETFLGYSHLLYRSKCYSDGELCRTLEARLAGFHEVTRVIAVNSGFWGHVIVMSALALPGRSEIIAPAFGYRRTDDMIAWAGCVPHFCDIDPVTLAVTPDTIRAALNERTALILAPHPMVRCCDAQEIGELGRRRGIPVVFDSVEAAYRTHSGRRIGGFGNAEVFSMHATKLLNAFEGGYITTNDTELAQRLDRMKRFGLVRDDSIDHTFALNAKLSDMHAAMALASLEEVDAQVAVNRRKYDLYVAGLRKISGLTIVEHIESERPDYRLIVVRIGEPWPFSREHTLRVLQAENVLARPYYTPLHHKTVEYRRICPELPITESLFRNLMVLPASAHVSEEDVENILHLLAKMSRYDTQLKSL